MSRVSIDDARRAALERVQTEGLRVAIAAAIDVAGDKKAPAPARATAAGLLLRAAALGGFGRTGEGGGSPKELHEMTGAELSRAAAEATALLGRLADDDARQATDAVGSVFD